MSNSQRYIEKYKELEAIVRSTYGISESDSISKFLKSKNEFRRFADQISYCQQVRNFMQHERKIDNKFSIEPSDAMISFIDTLIEKIKNRLQCKDISIKFKNVEWRCLSDLVKEAIHVMREKLFTHIPIIEDGLLVGVFDENSLFNYIADNEIVDIDDRLKFSDIKEYLSISDREMEDFIFVKGTMYVDELEKTIQSYFNRHKRIGVAFVTNNGRSDESIQGIITPWDIISADD